VILAAQGAPLVSLTPMANGKNLQPERFSLFHYFFWTPLGSGVSREIDFFFKFILSLSCHQFDNCFHSLPPVSFTPVANLLPVLLTPGTNLIPVSTTLAKLVEKFATGVVDTGGAP
jgi:hypothetical protein